MKYLACLALALLVTGMTVEEYSPYYGLPAMTITFLALVGAWEIFDRLIDKVARSL